MTVVRLSGRSFLSKARRGIADAERASKPRRKAYVPLEKEVQDTILKFLQARAIPYIRQNVGARPWVDRLGKNRIVTYGVPGMADVQCWPASGVTLWIEVKRPGEKQSTKQVAFELWAQSLGHSYAVVTCLEELLGTLHSLGVQL